MRYYSKDELKKLPMISQSHHSVFSDGEVFLKKARDNGGSSEIVLEYTVQKSLGIKSALIPGPPVSLLTPNYGDQLTSLDESTVREAVRVMHKIAVSTKKDIDDLSSIAPSVNDFREKVERKIAWRVSEGRNPAKLFSFLPEERAFDESSYVLCHCDPRPENWLRDENDKLILIDWESAVIAPWEFAVVSFASYVYEYGNKELLSAIFDEALKFQKLDPAIIEWSAALRRISVCSWYFDDEGEEVGNNWMRGLTEAWNQLDVKP